MKAQSRRERARNALDLLQAEGDQNAAVTEPESQPVSPLQALIRDLVAGFLVALVAIPMCLSSSALIYSGDLAPLIPVGVAGAFIGCTVVAAVTAMLSSMPFAIGTVALEIGILLAYIGQHVAGRVREPSQLLPTVWAAVMLGTALTGVALLLIGRLGVGRWIRFMPYPVIAGFLAGMGALAFGGAFRVMAGRSLSLSTLPELMRWESVLLWIPGVLFAISLIAIRSQTDHHLVMPLLVTGWFVLFNLGCGIATMAEVPVPAEWFFSSVSPAGFVGFIRDFRLSAVDWEVVLDQLPLFAAMAILAASSILLYCSTLEVAWGADCDPNRELQVSGTACLASALCGGLAGHLSLGMSMLSWEAHGRNRAVGLAMAACVLLVLLLGMPLIAFYPKPIIGGLLLSFGLVMVVEYLGISATRLPKLEWSVIAIITAVITMIGLLEGVVAGLILSCIQFAVACSRQQIIKSETNGALKQSRVQRTLPQQRILHQEGVTRIFELQGFLFFGVATVLLERLRNLAEDPRSKPKFVIYDFRLVNGIDSSVLNCFARMKQVAEQRRTHVIFTEVSPQIRQQIEASRLLIDEKSLRLIESRDSALEMCEDQILTSNVVRRARVIPLGVVLGQMGLDAATSRYLVEIMHRRSLVEGEVVLQPGVLAQATMFIESGRLLEQQEEGQSLQRIRTLGPGTFVNKAALFQPHPQLTQLLAEEPTVLYELTHQDFLEARENIPEMVEPLLNLFLKLFAEQEAAGGVNAVSRKL